MAKKKTGSQRSNSNRAPHAHPLAPSPKSTSAGAASVAKAGANGSSSPSPMILSPNQSIASQYGTQATAANGTNEQFPDRTFELQRKIKYPPQVTLGHGGVAIWGGYLLEKERDRALQHHRKYITYSDMLANVGIIAAGVRHLINQISKANWTVEPADLGDDATAADEEQAEEYADLIEDMLYDMATPLPKVVGRSAMHRLHGFSIQEWTAKRRDDGLIGIADVEPRPQFSIWRWDVDSSGTVHGVEQYNVQTARYQYIPRAKTIYCVDNTFSDSPEGVGILRNAYPIAKRLQRFEQLEGFGLESDLRGIPVGRAPYSEIQAQVDAGTMSPARQAQMIGAMEDFIKNHIKHPALGLVLDSMVYKSKDAGETPSSIYQFGLDLLKSGNTSQAECAAAISRLCHEIAWLMGIEGMLLGSSAKGASSTGSHALAQTKEDRFAILVDGSLTDVGFALERDLIGPIFALNGWDPKFKPSLIPEKMQVAGVDEITQALRDLATAGAPLSPEDPAIDVVRELVGLPEHEVMPTEDDLQLRGKDGSQNQQDDSQPNSNGNGKNSNGKNGSKPQGKDPKSSAGAKAKDDASEPGDNSSQPAPKTPSASGNSNSKTKPSGAKKPKS